MLKAKTGVDYRIGHSVRIEAVFDSKSLHERNRDLEDRLPDIIAQRKKPNTGDIRDVLCSCGPKDVLAVGRSLFNHDNPHVNQDGSINTRTFDAIYQRGEQELRTRPRRIGMEILAAAHKVFGPNALKKAGAKDHEVFAAQIMGNIMENTPRPDVYQRLSQVMDIRAEEGGMQYRRSSFSSLLSKDTEESKEPEKDGNNPYKVISSENLINLTQGMTNFPKDVRLICAAQNNLLLCGDKAHKITNITGLAADGESLYVVTLDDPSCESPQPYVIKADRFGIQVKNMRELDQNTKESLGLKDHPYGGDGIPGSIEYVRIQGDKKDCWVGIIDAPKMAKQDMESELSINDASNTRQSGFKVLELGDGKLNVKTRYHIHKIEGVKRLAFDKGSLYVLNATDNVDQPGFLRVDKEGMTYRPLQDVFSSPELAQKLGFDLLRDTELIRRHDGNILPFGAVSKKSI